MYIQCIVTRIILNCLLNYLIKEPRSSHLFGGEGGMYTRILFNASKYSTNNFGNAASFILHFICCENDIKTYIFYRVFPHRLPSVLVNNNSFVRVFSCFLLCFFSLFQTILYSMRRIANSYAIKNKPIKAQNRVPTRYTSTI